MERNKATGLFGGALLCAGLAMGQPEFEFFETDFSGSYGSVAYSGASIGSAFQGDQATDEPFDTVVSGTDGITGTIFASTSQTASQIRTDVTWTETGFSPTGFAYTAVQVFFTVAQNAQLELAWDFRTTNNNAVIQVTEDVAGGDQLFLLDGPTGGSAFGSETIDLVAGDRYGLTFGLADLFTGDSIALTQSQFPVFISATLTPTPGAFAVLALAGAAATRRRRV